MRPAHLYIHAPFCARRCSYCDFAVTVAAEPPVRAWADAVGRELNALAEANDWGPLRPSTVYLGGGTPSLLGVGAIDRLTAGLGPSADLDDVVEFTAEANPESFTPALASDWRASGVNRLSLGAQTFHAPTLRWMGRLHGPDGPGLAVAAARSAGFDNVGLDLIFGLPDRLERDLDEDLDRILALEPEHVSVYGLSIESDTPLGRWVAEGREPAPDPDRYGDEYTLVADRLLYEGYSHYEVSNFARPGRESVHNAAYWRGVPYLGLGSGAHSFVPPTRWWNRRDWAAYRDAVEADGHGRAGSEVVEAEAAALETTWLGLRTAQGLPRDDLDATQLARVVEWDRHGWTVPDPDRVRLSVAGWLLLDRLAVELDAAGGPG